MSYMAGIDRIGSAGLAGRKCAFLTNSAALSRDGRRAVEAAMDAGVRLVRLLSPEHGLDLQAAEGVHVSSGKDSATGLPVSSLYDGSREVSTGVFEGVDTVLVDLPDVGVRYFTYADALFRMMDACASAGRDLVLLDRANPLGRTLEGPLLEMRHASDVGRFPVPVRHGMTLGEYAILTMERFGVAPGLRFTVVPPLFSMSSADSCFLDFGCAWTAPSPNLNSFEALCCYPGTCLFEGTNLSEGRGTDTPFQLVGAPFVESDAILAALEGRCFPGLELAPATFTPKSGKHAGDMCHGVKFSVMDARKCRAFEAALRVLDAARRLFPEFSFKAEHFDHLLGSQGFRLGTESLESLLSRAESECATFKQK